MAKKFIAQGRELVRNIKKSTVIYPHKPKGKNYFSYYIGQEIANPDTFIKRQKK